MATGYGISMRDSTPQCIVRVTRVWRSHLTAKELEIGCSTLLDMRGNTIADEMADRAATRVEVIPSQANAVQAIDGMAWQVRMRIIEPNLAASLPSPSVSSYHRAHQHTGKRGSRTETSCLKPGHLRGMRSKEDGTGVKFIDVQCAAELVASKVGSLIPRRVLQPWQGMTIDGWKRPP